MHLHAQRRAHDSFAIWCSIEEKPGGWVDLTVTPQPGGFTLQRALQPGSLVILTSQRPPARQALDWLTRFCDCPSTSFCIMDVLQHRCQCHTLYGVGEFVVWLSLVAT